MAGLAVDKLEAMFNKADADLDYLSRKLEFDVMCKDENAGGQPGQMNPSVILRRIAKVKEEFAAIVKEMEAIKEAEKEAMNFFQGELMNVCQLLQNLQSEAGVQAEKPEEVTKMESLLGVTTDQTEAVTTNGSVESSEEPSDTAVSNGMSQANRATAANGSTSQTCQATPRDCGSEMRVSPVERREGSDEMIEVNDEEFQSVSSLVRGRVKLLEVNQVYRILWRHFKEEKKSGALTSAEMYKMGMRVTGQTGQAKLKVLKSLKLVDVTKKGDVTLL